MVDFESACARGRRRPSWAVHATEAGSSATREVVGADPATAYAVIRVRGGSGSPISSRLFRPMTIRGKLYAAIVLTVLGPLVTTAVALHGMSQLGDRYDEVRERAERESVARELKFLVTDVNGWQTAYGYAGGELRARFVASANELRDELNLAKTELTDEAERTLLSQLSEEFEGFMELDAVAWGELQAGRPQETKRIFLGPELRRFEAMAATADELAVYEADEAAATDTDFDQARDDARRRLVAVALGAGVVIILLLVTANDIARMALEGERSVRERRDPESPDDPPS